MQKNIHILIVICLSFNIYAQQTTFTLTDYYSDNLFLSNQVDSIFNQLTTKQKAAQLIMSAVSSTDNVYTYANAQKLYNDTIVSNLIFLKGNINTIKTQINFFNQNKTNFQNLFACDCEPSLFNMKYFQTPSVQKTNTLKTAIEVSNAADTITAILKSTGIQINFAPVVDNATNKAVINNRSFGNNKSEIISNATNFINSTQQQNIAATIKHFPGHGNVVGDSHKNLVYINGDLKEVNTFKTILDSINPIFTMVGHIAIKNNQKYNTFNKPSTIDAGIVNGLLKNELKFKGIAITDAMNMLGVATIPNADFKALQAGIDMVLMPVNPSKLHKQIMQELNDKTLLSTQIEKSIKKIIRLKLCVME
jgi:beta-N-acetylhexosaminidase